LRFGHVHEHTQLSFQSLRKYRVFFLNTQKTSIRKTVTGRPFYIFSFSQYDRQQSSRTSCGACIIAGAPW
jgi:hypothetical protein